MSPTGRAPNVLDAGDDIAHFTGAERVGGRSFRAETPHLVDDVGFARGFHDDSLAPGHGSGHDAHQGNDAQVVVEPGVDDQRLQRRPRERPGWRNPLHELLQKGRNALPGLGADPHRGVRRQPDDVLDLPRDPFGLGLGQVDLVENRQHLQAVVDRRIAVGDGLRLHALGGIDDQQGALAGGQRPGNLVAEVHVPGGVDEIEQVGFAVRGPEIQGDALRLDGDAPLPLQVHGIEHLVGHLPFAQRAAMLNEAVGKGRLAVIDVGDDGKVANVVEALQHGVTRRKSGGEFS